MKLHFEEQAFQEDAIRSVVELFDGQPSAGGPHEVRLTTRVGLQFDELALGNRLVLEKEAILENLRGVQARANLELSPELVGGNQFSVEMETGTGKTYVYLRTIYELAVAYGWRKFIIVVPSVAIREGVRAQLRLMKEHLAQRYDNLPLDAWVYDSAGITRVRSFATGNDIQLMILNIDAFNKRDFNVMFVETDRLSGRAPIEFIEQCQPIVILDEPQNMESEKSREAISRLNPLFTLRYSATHRARYNLVYRLGPARAYQLGLVKHIEIFGVQDDPDFNKPYVRLVSVQPTKTRLTARIEIDTKGAKGQIRKTVTIGPNDDLEVKTGRSLYRGYVVTEISTRGGDHVEFGNGIVVSLDQPHGDHGDAVQRVQIRETIATHLDREVEMHKRSPEQRCKVLSLFFVDRVANYWPPEGKFRRWFHEEYEALRSKQKYAALRLPEAGLVHNGYFAIAKDGNARDSDGSTKADDDAYTLIMEKKEELLSPDVPLRFIFSHSALAEGWDNPNVFQLCVLRDVQSVVSRRQQIGRGLRLPVFADGTRSHQAHLNRLTIIANDSYAGFAKGLQEELAAETGEVGPPPANARERKKIALRDGWQLDPNFVALWEAIRRKTRYAVRFQTSTLVERAVAAIKKLPLTWRPVVRSSLHDVAITADGVKVGLAEIAHRHVIDAGAVAIPDAISYLQQDRRLPELTRATLAAILVGSERCGDLLVNPQQFLDQVARVVRRVLGQLLAEGVQYEEIAGRTWEMSLFESEEAISYVNRLVAIQHSIFDHVEYDSEIEKKIATGLDARRDIKMFVKLPRWFKVETPVGTYNPDWAVVKQDGDDAPKLYLVRESKGTDNEADLTDAASAKIYCGHKHFDRIGVPFKVVKTADDF